jgi:hypothetical protein
MAWKITKAHLDCVNDSVGIRSRSWQDATEGQATLKFRMKDDDGFLYVSGVCTPETEFEPLDDYGMPGLGCTSLEFYERGEWRPL